MAARGGAPLLLRMFGGRTKSGRSANLLAHTEHVLKSGYVLPPNWLTAVQLCAPGAACCRRLHARDARTHACAPRRLLPACCLRASRAENAARCRGTDASGCRCHTHGVHRTPPPGVPFPRGRPPKIVYPEARPRPRCVPLAARTAVGLLRRLPALRLRAFGARVEP
jgi:hypothetical protein